MERDIHTKLNHCDGGDDGDACADDCEVGRKEGSTLLADLFGSESPPQCTSGGRSEMCGAGSVGTTEGIDEMRKSGEVSGEGEKVSKSGGEVSKVGSGSEVSMECEIDEVGHVKIEDNGDKGVEFETPTPRAESGDRLSAQPLGDDKLEVVGVNEVGGEEKTEVLSEGAGRSERLGTVQLSASSCDHSMAAHPTASPHSTHAPNLTVTHPISGEIELITPTGNTSEGGVKADGDKSSQPHQRHSNTVQLCSTGGTDVRMSEVKDVKEVREVSTVKEVSAVNEEFDGKVVSDMKCDARDMGDATKLSEVRDPTEDTKVSDGKHSSTGGQAMDDIKTDEAVKDVAEQPHSSHSPLTGRKEQLLTAAPQPSPNLTQITSIQGDSPNTPLRWFFTLTATSGILFRNIEIPKKGEMIPVPVNSLVSRPPLGAKQPSVEVSLVCLHDLTFNLFLNHLLELDNSVRKHLKGLRQSRQMEDSSYPTHSPTSHLIPPHRTDDPYPHPTSLLELPCMRRYPVHLNWAHSLSRRVALSPLCREAVLATSRLTCEIAANLQLSSDIMCLALLYQHYCLDSLPLTSITDRTFLSPASLLLAWKVVEDGKGVHQAKKVYDLIRAMQRLLLNSHSPARGWRSVREGRTEAPSVQRHTPSIHEWTQSDDFAEMKDMRQRLKTTEGLILRHIHHRIENLRTAHSYVGQIVRGVVWSHCRRRHGDVTGQSGCAVSVTEGSKCRAGVNGAPPPRSQMVNPRCLIEDCMSREEFIECVEAICIDMYQSPLCLEYLPEEIALAAIWFAAISRRIPLIDNAVLPCLVSPQSPSFPHSVSANFSTHDAQATVSPSCVYYVPTTSPTHLAPLHLTHRVKPPLGSRPSSPTEFLPPRSSPTSPRIISPEAITTKVPRPVSPASQPPPPPPRPSALPTISASVNPPTASDIDMDVGCVKPVNPTGTGPQAADAPPPSFIEVKPDPVSHTSPPAKRRARVKAGARPSPATGEAGESPGKPQSPASGDSKTSPTAPPSPRSDAPQMMPQISPTPASTTSPHSPEPSIRAATEGQRKASSIGETDSDIPSLKPNEQRKGEAERQSPRTGEVCAVKEESKMRGVSGVPTGGAWCPENSDAPTSSLPTLTAQPDPTAIKSPRSSRRSTPQAQTPTMKKPSNKEWYEDVAPHIRPADLISASRDIRLTYQWLHDTNTEWFWASAITNLSERRAHRSLNEATSNSTHPIKQEEGDMGPSCGPGIVLERRLSEDGSRRPNRGSSEAARGENMDVGL
eukprot:GHVN01090074.1.p1 GENE.GHVN01090074.1~~GHVN01090074.1.p1  ORF type:complete len:1479 (+),score=449.52 GHVN01090074.1:652-4437(+)